MATFGFEDRSAENSKRLQVYDQLANTQQRMSLAQQKAQFEQAFKESEQQRKQAATEEHLKIANDRLDLLKQQREVQQSVADAKLESMRAEMALQQHKAESTAEVARQTTAMFNGLEDSRDARGFVPPSAIAKLRAQFPDAAMHANNASALEHEVRRFDDAAKLDDAAKAAKYGTTSTLVKGPDGQTLRVTVPNGPPGSAQQTTALKAQHDALQAGLQDKDGNYLTGDALKAQVNLLNPVKEALGFQKLDPATGQAASPADPNAIVPAAAGAATGGIAPVTADATQAAGAALTALAPSPAPGDAALKPATDDILRSARAAITGGKDAAAVANRLKQSGYDPSGL